jgi:hypothetical protein
MHPWKCCVFFGHGYIEGQVPVHLPPSATLHQESTNPGRQISRTTTFCMVALNICVSSIELVSCCHCGNYNFELTPRFLENLCNLVFQDCGCGCISPSRQCLILSIKVLLHMSYKQAASLVASGDLNLLVESTAVLVHAMKAYSGRGGISPLIANRGTRCRWVREKLLPSWESNNKFLSYLYRWHPVLIYDEQNGSTDCKSQLNFYNFCCWLHVLTLVKIIIRQLKIKKQR